MKKIGLYILSLLALFLGAYFLYVQYRPHSFLRGNPQVVTVSNFTKGDWAFDRSIGLSDEQIQRCLDRVAKFSRRFYQVDYKSDGLIVSAIVGIPREFNESQKYPLLVFNRGGNRSFGQTNICSLKFLEDFGSTLGNAVVVASQYRGSFGSEGQDEFGGNDLNDVLNLIKWTESLKFIDHENRFLLGWSRGGMMTYLTLKAGIRFNAAAAVATPSDMFGLESLRPEMKQLHQELIPQYKESRDAELAARSALRWPEKIEAPILLVHGESDWRVNFKDSVRMAEALKKLSKPHRLVLYPGDDHGLTKSYGKMLEEVRAWFLANRTD